MKSLVYKTDSRLLYIMLIEIHKEASEATLEKMNSYWLEKLETYELQKKPTINLLTEESVEILLKKTSHALFDADSRRYYIPTETFFPVMKAFYLLYIKGKYLNIEAIEKDVLENLEAYGHLTDKNIGHFKIYFDEKRLKENKNLGWFINQQYKHMEETKC